MEPKKKIKIYFKHFWPDFDPENNLFTRLLRNKYDVEINKNADYVFYSVYTNKKPIRVNSKARELVKLYLYPFLPFVKKAYTKIRKIDETEKPSDKAINIFYTAENIKPDMKKYDWAFSFLYDEDFKHPRHLRLPNYKFEETGLPPKKNKSNTKKTIKEKNKFCNFIYSNETKLRKDFFIKLSKYKRIDSPGKFMNNMERDKGRPKKWVQEKIEFLKPYKFTIAFENESNPGYNTEKIYHPMLTNSIPIYYGNPLIGKDFNTKSFINCHEYKDFKEVMKRIIEIDNDDKLYEQILREPWFNGDKPSIYMEDERILNQLIKIVESKNEFKR